jgi:hypothetical protein
MSRELQTLLDLEDLFKSDREYLWQLKDHIGSLMELTDRAEHRAEGCGCPSCRKQALAVTQRLLDAEFKYEVERMRQDPTEEHTDTDEYYLTLFALSKLEDEQWSNDLD